MTSIVALLLIVIENGGKGGAKGGGEGGGVNGGGCIGGMLGGGGNGGGGLASISMRISLDNCTFVTISDTPSNTFIKSGFSFRISSYLLLMACNSRRRGNISTETEYKEFESCVVVPCIIFSALVFR